MAFTHGKNGILKLNDGSSLRDVSAYLSEVSFPQERALIEATVLGATGVQFVPGIPSASFSLSGYFDPTFDGYLYAMYQGQTAAAFSYWPAGGGTTATASQPSYTGNMYLASYEESNSADGIAAVKAELKITGGVTRNVS